MNKLNFSSSYLTTVVSADYASSSYENTRNEETEQYEEIEQIVNNLSITSSQKLTRRFDATFIDEWGNSTSIKKMSINQRKRICQASTTVFSLTNYRSQLIETKQRFELECQTRSPANLEAKLWNVTFRKIKNHLSKVSENNNVEASHILEMKLSIAEELRQHFERAKVDHLIALAFVQDLKEKSLLEFYTKYFSSDASPLFHCKDLSFVYDLSQIFTTDQALTWMEIEAKAIIQKILEEQVLPKPVNRNELLRLLVHLEQLKRICKDPSFDCYVLDIHEFESVLINIINELIEEPVRKQFLIKNGVHYTAVDSELSIPEKQAFVLDAAADIKYEEVIKILKAFNFDIIYQVGHQRQVTIHVKDETTSYLEINVNKQQILKKFVAYLNVDNILVQQPAPGQEVTEKHSIQSDSYNCAVFGFNQLVHTSKQKELFKILAQLDNQDQLNGARLIYWFQLPPQLIKNTSYLRFFENYYKENVGSTRDIYKKGLTFEKYIESRSTEREINLKTRKVNISIEIKLEQYAKKAEQFISSHAFEKIAGIACLHPTYRLKTRNLSDK